VRVRRTALLLFPLLLVAACGPYVALRPTAEDGRGAPATASNGQLAGSDVANQPSLQQQLADRDREIAQLRSDVQAARTREHELRASLQGATSGAGVDAAGSHPTEPGAGGGPAMSTAAAARPDVVVTALRAALSQEQARRQVVETQLTRLKEETSAVYSGARVPEADFLAVKQELVDLRQALADERAARQRLSAQMQSPQGDGAPANASTEAADLRVALQNLQERKDAIVESLNRSLAASHQRVAELEQQLGAGATPSMPENMAAGTTTDAGAETSALRAQLHEERRRSEDLAAKLKVATRLTDLIFKIQAQQAKPPARPKPRR
jgi:predicted  nucleic acid-binding Zn-ribbon protein